MTDQNAVTIRQADFKEFSDDIEYCCNLLAAVESAKEAYNERCKKLADKYKEHPTFAMKPASLKKVVSIVYKDSLDEERSKAEEIFDLIEALQEKE